MKKLAILVLVAALSGCAVGNRADYRMAITTTEVASDGRVAVAVIDNRPYVVSRQKHPHWVGIMRSLGGIPYSIGTASGRSLASDLTDAVVGSLLQSGVMARPADADARTARRAEKSDERLLIVEVLEWKSHHYMRASFAYDVAVSVYDAAGRRLASHQVKSNDHTANIIESGKVAIRQALASPSVIAALAAPLSPALPVAAVKSLAADPSQPAYDACMERVMRISDETLRLQAMASCDAVQ